MRALARSSVQAPESQVVIGDRYLVEGPLGRGGAAQVYRVRDRATGTPLALKKLAPQASRKLSALFELEYQTLASIQHPSVVRAFEFGRDQGTAFYTMELLEGEDLRECAPVCFREVCGYLRDAAQALELLHARRLVHRDVSPRNLWRTPAGHVKLIDFGSLAPFGRSDHVIGTPPFMAPEALHGQELDQRTDLYALGAVAYYLLTRTHAFGARDMGELPALWREPPIPPSVRVAELARADLAPVPAELDALVLALLSPSMLARPSSGAEVIDRIDALIGRPADATCAQREVVRAHLSSTAHVGQRRARRSLERQLLLARRGRGQSCLIEGEPGSGRTRILREIALGAQIAEAAVLSVRASGPERPYELASALALQLLRVLPNEARAAARPHAATLALLSPEVAEALDERGDAASNAAELRFRLQRALRDWFLGVAEQRLLLVLVDDLERADEGSLAFLLALTEARRRAHLLLVCSVTRAPHQVTAPEQALRALAHMVRLEPLDEADSLTLIRSVFGNAENVGRLASRLWRASRGNPGHLIELCEQLLARDVIGYVDGTWLLPHELPRELLSASREEALLARLAQLDERTRSLGRALSVHANPTPLELARALADDLTSGSFASLRALLDAGVCMTDGETLYFAHEPQRRALLAELAPEARKRAHSVVGTFLLERATSALARLQAGVHLLESGDPRGPALVATTTLHIALHESDTIKPAAPATERALTLLRAEGRPQREQVPLLALLSIAGYSADRRYAAQYGKSTVAALREVVGLPLAQTLRPYLGRKLSLIAALLVAGVRLVRYRKDPRVVSLKDAIALMFSAVVALAGTSTVCIHPEGVLAYADVLEPFRALGPKHAASFMYDYCLALAETARDHHARTRLRWKDLLARLESESLVQGLTDSIRQRLLHGALNALGVIEAQRDGEEALRLAERAENAGLLLSSMGAEQIRALYYANQGNVALFERHRARAELHAIQQGTSWQVETWTPSAKAYIAFRAHDAMGLKQAAEQLHRLSQGTPSLVRAAQRVRGAYLAVRGRSPEAIPLLEEVLRGEPRDYAGWTRTHAMLATALNEVGQHQRALDACLHALRHSTPEDLAFGGAILLVQREQLVAEAALGDADRAYEQVTALIQRHEATGGALTVGELHDAGLTIALLRGDLETARMHFGEMERRYLSTGVPSLAQHCARRRRKLMSGALRLSGDISRAAALTSTTVVSSLATQGPAPTVEQMLAGGALSFGERAQKALQIVAQKAQVQHGHLYVLDENDGLREAASLQDEVLPPEVVRWLKLRISSELDEDAATQMLDSITAGESDSSALTVDGRYYRMVPLTAARVIGCVALASDELVPPHCDAEVLNTVAFHLSRAMQQKTTVHDEI